MNVKFSTTQIENELRRKYKMSVRVLSRSQEVTFYGSKSDCEKMKQNASKKECKIKYCNQMKCYCVVFPEWFSYEYSQSIV